MRAQEQKQPETRNLFTDSEEETSTSAHSPKKRKGMGFFAVLGVITACFICTGVGMALRRDTALFLEKRTVDGYLAPEDYILISRDTGEPVQNVRSFRIKTMHTWDGSGLMTNRGIAEGSSWEEFVDAYSDVHADSFTYYKNSPDNYSVDYSDGIYLTEPMTIAEFSREYCGSGQFDPKTDRIYVNFELNTDGIRLYYTEQELREALDKYYDTPSVLQPFVSYPRASTFNMSFVISPKEGVQYISSSYY
ncbi:MAG: hypothetical protein IKD66_03030 [Solobacterium sp.]|nr:hypothetical protein [Solobacterium sp.]